MTREQAIALKSWLDPTGSGKDSREPDALRNFMSKTRGYQIVVARDPQTGNAAPQFQKTFVKPIKKLYPNGQSDLKARRKPNR